jgi:hypothetical protein
MMRYYLINRESVSGNIFECLEAERSDGVWLSIPMSEENPDYQAYLEWLAQGNEPEIIEQ